MLHLVPLGVVAIDPKFAVGLRQQSARSSHSSVSVNCMTTQSELINPFGN